MHSHEVVGGMLGIETNTYQLTWLVAQIEMEASKRPRIAQRDGSSSE